MKKINIKKNNNTVKITVNGLTIEELTPELMDSTVDEIKNLLTEKIDIIDSLQGEGFPPNPMKITSAIINRLNEKYPNSYNDYIIISGGLDVPLNHVLYDKICKKYNLIKAKIFFNNGWEYSTAGHHAANNRELYDEQINLEPRLKSKKFLSFNNTLRSHRYYMLSQMIKNQILDKGFVSFLYRRKDGLEQISSLRWFYYTIMKYQLPNLADEIFNIVKDNLHLLPLELNWFDDEDYKKYCFSIVNDFSYYNDSYFSLVTETKFFKDIEEYTDSQYDCIFFTEKTWKPILAKHPFILAARPYCLKSLRDIGYKTFHPFINETYDDIEDDEKRLEAIFSEILRLSKLSDNEWLDWQSSVNEIVKFNFEHCISRYNKYMK